MKVYLVGGAIRDEMLGLPVKEKDWVVVGATPEALIAEGFQPVGKDFPVFLHPETHEEYALARTERKTGKGYKGFTFHAESNVKLEDDLRRRDLTINAMARSEDGTLIDPYGGQKDLTHKILRHISPAFAEDPVRILRVARFAAKLPDFVVTPETIHLMQSMVVNGEVNALVAERVWQEFSKALIEKQPFRFFEVLQDCDALPILFPGIHLNSRGILALHRACELTTSGPIRFAALMHNTDLATVQEYAQRYRIPKEYTELAELSCQYTTMYDDILNSSQEAILHFIKKTDALRRPNRFANFLICCHACLEESDLQNRDDHIHKVIEALKNVDISSLQERNLKGKEFAEAMQQLQIKSIQEALK